MRVPAAGGTPEVLTKPDVSKGEYGHWFPHPLPDGRGILFTVSLSASPEIAGHADRRLRFAHA